MSSVTFGYSKLDRLYLIFTKCTDTHCLHKYGDSLSSITQYLIAIHHNKLTAILILGMSVRILLIIVSRFFLTSPRHEYIEPVVSNEKTRSIGDPAEWVGAATFRFSPWATFAPFPFFGVPVKINIAISCAGKKREYTRMFKIKSINQSGFVKI